MKNKQTQYQEIGNYIDQKIFNEMIEEQIQNKILLHPKWHDKIQQAKIEGWLGEPWQRGKNGLLGYFRTSFGIQIKILEKLSNPVPIYQPEFIDWFRSDWFRNKIIENRFISDSLIKNDHIETIRQKKFN